MSNCALCDTCVFSEPQSELYYEIHVTVNHSENFVNDCYELGIKPIIIDMGEDVPVHVMTSATIKGNDASAFATANGFADAFRDRGYEVLRIKIETVPWHPCASHPTVDQYFETHFAIKLPCDESRLKHMAEQLNLHYSKNILKKGDVSVQMLTYRSSKIMDAEQFQEIVDRTKQALMDNGFKFEKTIVEFALYDTNVKLDDKWLKSASRNQN